MTDPVRPIRTVALDPRLWMLVSPALPVGGYSYSQGLEQAVSAGWIRDADDAAGWIRGLLFSTVTHVDLAHLFRIHRALDDACAEAVARWNRSLLACRETAELRREDRDMGAALMRLAGVLDLADGALVPEQPVFATAFALVGRAIDLPAHALLTAYAWVWCENQVAAAVKLVPLGQTTGQRILLDLAGVIDGAADRAQSLTDDVLGATAPGLAIASAAHETQYTRLFRS